MAKSNGASLGFENKLWEMADKLRGHMDAAEYKHVVLGLIFLKYISDAFQAKYDELDAAKDTDYTDPEDRDEYAAANVFWVPKEARWADIQAAAKLPVIGKKVDDAMDAIERENPTLKGVLQKDYARPTLDKHRLGQLIDVIAGIGLGDKAGKSKDVLGRVYEYFLSKFAAAEGKLGGEFYTPRCIVQLLVEMIEPYKGRVYDPCCGSGGMFVQSERFVEEHGGRVGDIAIYGQESNPTTWRLARMNLALRGIDVDLGQHNADTFHNDLHKDLRADYILANPPFNMSDWGGDRLRDDVRWKHGAPPANNANYAWIQHFIHHLAPHGVAGFVLANGSMSTSTNAEGDIRQSIIEADLVDCMIALPGQLFYTTQIPVCLWFICRDKSGKPSPRTPLPKVEGTLETDDDPRPVGEGGRRPGEGWRDRRGETLFIDARKLGELTDRVHRELKEDDITRIATTYHAWRSEGQTLPSPAGRGAGGEGKPVMEAYTDIAGFCKSATLDDIKGHHYVLTPGRYVGAEAVEDDGIPFEEKMADLTATLYEQMAEGQALDTAIKKNMEMLGYGE